MSLDHPAATERTSPDQLDAPSVDPFAVVACLIVAILLGSLLLWLNGHDKINDMRQPAASTTSSSLTSVG